MKMYHIQFFDTLTWQDADIIYYFVVGTRDSIQRVLSAASAMKTFGRKYSWYAVSKVSSSSSLVLGHLRILTRHDRGRNVVSCSTYMQLRQVKSVFVLKVYFALCISRLGCAPSIVFEKKLSSILLVEMVFLLVRSDVLSGFEDRESSCLIEPSSCGGQWACSLSAHTNILEVVKGVDWAVC